MSTNHTEWPKAIDEAVNQTLSWLLEEDQFLFKSADEEDFVKLCSGLGRIIRNEFGLWAGNKELLGSCGLKSMHTDDASIMIIKAVWERIVEVEQKRH